MGYKKKLNFEKQNVGLFTMVRALQQHMDLLTQKRVKLQQLKTHLSCISKERRTCKVEMSIGRENAVVHILFCCQTAFLTKINVANEAAHQPINVLRTLFTIRLLARLLAKGNSRDSSKRNL